MYIFIHMNVQCTPLCGASFVYISDAKDILSNPCGEHSASSAEHRLAFRECCLRSTLWSDTLFLSYVGYFVCEDAKHGEFLKGPK